ncbi:hypothetical protein PG991_012600 [Apiospora marii]|uniref:Uncharacterized protein n=1 Tax=Apiospora marii TaxID=335849 RepID=A0ABR1RA76_9PEZI
MENGTERKPSVTPNGQDRGTSESAVVESALSMSPFVSFPALRQSPSWVPLSPPLSPDVKCYGCQCQTLPPLFEALDANGGDYMTMV